jgi:signal transduction histidine kinase
VVQEALTNAAKHARGQRVEIVITAEADELTVEITNPRASVETTRSAAEGTNARRAAEGSNIRSAGDPVVPGSGYGLLGMRERVSLAGGQLEAGWVGEQFRIRAVLPMKAAE